MSKGRNYTRFKSVANLLGPAFIAAVAYVDPGNFAANFSAGAQYGYMLLWVLVVANLMASLVQYLSAKVGLVTGKSLPEVIAEELPNKARIAYWLQAEIVAAATDIAEVIGGAIALQLLFGLPLVVGGMITGVISFVLLLFYTQHGQKVFERVIVGLLLIIPIGFFAGLMISPPHIYQVVSGLIPQLHNENMVLLAVAMLGATIMPHVVYLHSALARDRHGHVEVHRLNGFLKITRIDVLIAMIVAGSVNIAMLLLAASALYGTPHADTLPGIFSGLHDHLGALVALLFALGLLVSGLASTAVGSYAGSVIMQGMLHRRISPVIRRIIVTIPAILLLLCNVDATMALVVSQVALSFGIPFALIPLALVSGNSRIMGKAANNSLIKCLIWSITLVIVGLNAILIILTCIKK